MTATSKRKRIKRVSVGLAGLALALIALECGLRVAAVECFGQAMAWQGMFVSTGPNRFFLQPGFVGKQTVGGRRTEIRIDAAGRRSSIGDSKWRGPGILMLGDSMVFGDGVAGDETIAAQLRLALTNPPSGVRVANAGVPGHGTQDLAASLRHHQAFAPELILAFTFLGNDFVDDCRQHCDVVEDFLLLGATARAARCSVRMRLALRFRTAYLFERTLLDIAPSLAYDATAQPRTPAEINAWKWFPATAAQRFAGLCLDRRQPDALVAEVMRRCRSNYQALLDVAGTTPVLLVVLPTWWHLRSDTWAGKLQDLGFDSDEYEFGAIQRRLVELAQELGMPVVDLSTALGRAKDRDALFIPGDGHLSALGCQRVASTLRARVEDLLGR